MTMTIPEAIASFSGLDHDGKADFLALLAHELTIAARDTYEVGGNSLTDPARMRSINEIQHRLLGFLASLLNGDRERYSDEMLVRWALEHPEDSVLQQQLSWAFDRALSLTKRLSPNLLRAPGAA